MNQKPIVKIGDKVKKGQIMADGAATCKGELALGRNVLVAFMSWEGYNFEDAIIISERLVKNDTYTSIHIEEFDIEIRETKLGREEFTRDIPNVSPKALANLDENGIVQIGTYVQPGDILVGKVSPKSRSELTPEEKLLHAIFGRSGEDVKNDSLEVPSGVEGIVIDTQRFSRQTSMTEEEKKAVAKERRDIEARFGKMIAEQFRTFVEELEGVLEKKDLKDPLTGKPLASEKEDKAVAEQAVGFKIENLDVRSPAKLEKVRELWKRHNERIQELHRDARAQAQLAQSRRRIAIRRAADGQGLLRHETADFRRRQDGRPARQQGGDLEDPARRGHAVPGGRHAGRHPAQSARRAQPYERGPDSRNSPRLRRRQARLQGGDAGLRRGRGARDQGRA